MTLLPDRIPLESTIPDEPTLKSHWQATIQRGNLLQTAFSMGLHADRLSWVFMAAYQCALREAFPDIPDREWWALAASEDRKGELPGVTLDNGRLNGFKTWVAGSDNLDSIVVTIGRSAYLVPRNAEGASIDTYPAASFLGDMSVGRLELKGVEAGKAFELKADFALAEPFYITSAACGYLLRETTRLGEMALSERVKECTQDLADLEIRGYSDHLNQFADIYQQVSSLGKQTGLVAQDLADGSARDWSSNGKLLSMYRRGIEKRL